MPNTSLRQPNKGFKRGGKTAYHGSSRTKTKTFAASGRTEATSADEKWERTRLAHTIDETMGFARFDSGKRREGWLVNIQPTSLPDDRNPEGRAAVDCYFIEEGNTTFKASVEYEPYFLVAVKTGYEGVVEEWLKRIGGGGVVKSVKKILKEDLSLPNHLLGLKRTLLELRFLNVADLLTARREIMPIAERNRKGQSAKDAYAESVAIDGKLDLFDDLREDDYQAQGKIADATEFITDIREYDVPYMTRVMIDLDIRVGKWYFIDAKHGEVSVKCNEERLAPADPVVMAFDIETTKLPLKFPDTAIDQIMMISYMIDGNGFLITNREIVSEDIYDFDYTAKAEYPGNFKIFNEPNERAVIERFFNHIKETRPTVIATYNGDFFDWPFVEARSSVNGIDMYQEIGWRKVGEEYQCNYSVHMDCFAWVTRDSYLPQGSRGLKAVTVAKLGYDPDELDPELMTPYARERPQTLAEYSVSDAVATYYLYLKYVHPFIFSLCATLPLGPDQALRKGTGTLCEMLLMVQAYQNGILLPNKHVAPRESFWKGHLINSETYVGGHVESIEAGVFRSDIPVNFAMEEGAIDELLRDLDDALKFSITVEEKKSLDDIENYDEIKEKITAQLRALKETPNRTEGPLIYHVDVASMYPNIMTTNRLQPDSMITDADCAACDFNRPGKTCDRRLPWAWRGEYLPAKRDEYNMIRNTLENEKFPGKYPNSPMRPFRDLPLDEQAALTRKRLQDYSKKVYHKIHDSTTMVREAIICQRENPFYVNTVRSFRDRRYDYKGKAKVWKGKKEALKSSGAPTSEVDTANKMIILFDSMQLAHKVILNSFYGYVMRKGSRWYSMEMAGVTCLTGAHIIQMAKDLVERLGRPLELDTDGIWCMLPKSFPENFAFKMKNGKKLAISYPCVMLNHLVHAKFTNHQYQTLKDAKSFRYETHSDNSIFFEVDGPYKAMVLPTSKEEDKNLKKRYAVFNDDGSLAELKGFEVKRRGELQLIKIFQQQIFKFFLDGSTLAECYGAVARVADRWLDVLHQKGGDLSDDELLDLICENRMMSKTLQEYGSQKSTSITTAKRLADFLGENMIKDKGLACKFIISANPKGAPVTERAVPVAILSAPEETKRKFLRKWLKGDPPSTDVRDLLDWEYYTERLGSVIQKLITIPAALQKVPNPVPRIPHPEWLRKRIATREDKMQQTKLSFAKLPLNDITNRATPRADDMEDFGSPLFGAKIGTIVHSSETGSQSKVKMAPKRKSPEPAEIEPPEELPAVMPSMHDDYVGFIAYQKQKWKRQKEARARRRQLFGDRRGGGNSHIQQSFMRAAHSTFMTTWQLVYLNPEDNNGVVTAHVLIDAKIHSLKIRVPRQIYVNYKRKKLPALQPPKGCVVEKVNHTLPNGRPSALIHRMTMPEESYVGAEQWLCDLRSHPSVEAIYETGVPLYMRALLKLGNVCAIDDTQHAVLGTGLEQGFDLSGLVRPQKGRTYLEDVPLSYIYISHINTPERQIFGIFSTTSENAHLVILTKQRDAGQDMPNLSKLYGQKLEEHIKEAGEAQFKDFFRYQEKLNFKVTQVTTRRKAHLEVGDVVKKMRKEEPRAQILAIQSLNKESLIRDIPGLGDMPILPLKYDVYDGALPPLGWQSTVARRLVRHYLGLGGELTHLMALARYANVPLCNLERDDPRYLIDINYARRLMTNDVVLWWSAGPRPDHGRNEFDDVTGPLEMIKMPTVNHPGTFNAVCIELEVRNLAINTILTASLINNLEGADANPMSALADISGDVDGIMYSEGAFSNTNILVLREMVKSWWGEACRGSPMADLMVNHLVRWIEDPDSFLYDRALHYYVQLICRKAFQQLMGDFRKVGCQVVFANAGRMILQTGKYDVQNAASYAEYITRSIKSQPLFHFIDLEIKEYWDFLVWYDEYNYGGKGCYEVVGEEGEQALETIMHWQMSTYLPLRLQPTFTKWVAEFVNIMHEVKRPGIASASQSAGVGDDGAPRATQLSTRERMKGLEEKRNDAAPGAEDVISGKALERPLKREIAQLIKVQKKEMMHAELEGDYAFPRLPASAFNGKDTREGVLELVKCLMQVLSLDKNVTSDARLLRRDLLGMFEVREFSKRGNFSNPAGSLRLAGVSCENCAMPRELDFCRDEDLLPDVLPSGARGPQGAKTWRCACGWEVSRLELEERLVAEVEKVVVGWATQDAKCGKCGAVRVNEFSEHCTCSGAWVDGTDREEVRERVRVYEGVAEYYDLRMLGMVVKEVLEEM
ncbi:probable DNA polymerase epsilon, calytic chain POL2 [Cephalotrichum gorgonifer]|uniref:DNA polymerase epsilon catalytic subunit n=1 Tax=Cephalotrichum gorgonifer TaxID=2041049 RepID=A0AAE8N0L9_9PEZI|nr:probable DNA polymerase epsilon, calytic chain POL2 [Cephalotrichum gorgonifer]